jgi:hypothetical protein
MDIGRIVREVEALPDTEGGPIPVPDPTLEPVADPAHEPERRSG